MSHTPTESKPSITHIQDIFSRLTDNSEHNFINHESEKLNSISTRNSPVDAVKFRIIVINQKAKSSTVFLRTFLRVKREGLDRLQANIPVLEGISCLHVTRL